MDQNQIKIKNITKKRAKYIITYERLEEVNVIESVILDEEQILSERILVDKVFDQEKWNDIIQSAGLYLGVKQAINYLGFKPRSSGEVRLYLKEKDYDSDTIHKIMDKLNDMNLLNDERFTTDFIDSYRYNLKGPLLIRHHLEQKGLSRRLIEEKLSAYTHTQEEENIKTIVEKEKYRLNTYPINKQKELIIQKLIRDGFTSSLVHQVMKGTQFDSNHEERLEKDFNKVTSKTDDKSKILQKLMQKGYNYQDIKKLMENE